MPIEPETKDWTWVLERACPECGTEAGAHSPATAPDVLRDAVVRWEVVLRRPDAARRPDGSTWSPLEYAAHVRDVCAVFRTRLGLILAETRPTFPDWDQDAAAVADRYAEQDPAAVAAELAGNARALSDAFAAVPHDAWERSGTRGDGTVFTVRTLAGYLVHEVLHHLHDVGG